MDLVERLVGLLALLDIEVGDGPTERDRLRLHPRIYLRVDGPEHGQRYGRTDHDIAMPAHEGDRPLSEDLRQSLPERAVADQHIRHAARLADVEDWDALGEKSRDVI